MADKADVVINNRSEQAMKPIKRANSQVHVNNANINDTNYANIRMKRQ